MKKLLTIGSIFLFTALTSCSSLNSKFECSMKPGVRCESLDSVNARIDRGEIGQEEVQNSAISYSTSIRGQAKIHKPSQNEHEPIRSGETVTRVWIAPYEDTAGNYHQESEIYTVVKPGHWIGYPIKATLDDERVS